MNWDNIFDTQRKATLTRFYQLRADALEELYKRLSPTGQMMSEAIHLVQVGRQKDSIQCLKRAGERVNDFIAYFERHRISLTNPFCKRIDDFLEEFKRTWSHFAIFPDDITATGSEWHEAWSKFIENISAVLDEIEEQFRRIVRTTL